MTRISIRSALLGTAMVIGTSCLPDATALTVFLTPNNPTTTDSLEVNGALDGLNISWYQDGVLRGDLADEHVVVAEHTQKDEEWTVVVSDDSQKGWAMPTDSVTIINTPPVVISVALDPPAPTERDTVSVDVESQDADNDEVSFHYKWEREGSGVSSAQETLRPEDTSVGQTWTVTVTPYDSEEEGEPNADTSFTIANEPPEMVSVTLTPDPAYEASTLEAVTTESDPNSDEITLSYTWTVAGVDVPSVDQATLDGEFFDKGDAVQVKVTPSDGEWEGEPMSSNIVTISNSLPSITTVEITPNPARATDDLSCVPSGWADDDGDEEDYRYTWLVNSVDQGIDEPTIQNGPYLKADLVQCTCTPLDGEEEGDTVESDPLVVQNTPPFLDTSTITVSPEYPSILDTMEVFTDTEDADGDMVTILYEWLVDNVVVGTDSTLSLAGFSRNSQLDVNVTPFDGEDEGSGWGWATFIENSIPSLASVDIGPDPLPSNGLATATPVGENDADGDVVVYVHEWHVNGSPVANETGPTLDGLQHFGAGQQVYVTATPSDGFDDGSPVTSDTITVNTPPGVAAVSISPDPATALDTLVCAHDTPADVDGDTVSYTYTWTVNGVSQTPVIDDAELPASVSIERDMVVTCSVTPNDGIEDGASVGPATLTISNSPPTVSTPQLTGASSGGLRTNDVITASAYASDADGDPNLDLLYAWYVGGTLLQTETTEFLNGATAFERGQEVYVQVTPRDTFDYGPPEQSAVHTVVNTPPGAATVSMSSLEPKQGQDDIVCQVDIPASDEDASDDVDYTFDWTVDGNTPTTVTPIQTHYLGDTISKDDIQVQEVWVCTVTPTDGTDDGPSADATATVLPPFQGWAVTPWSVDNAADVIFEAEGDYEYIEWISGAGDVDNDGLADVLVGMKRAEYYGPSKVYLFRSSSGSLAPSTTEGNVSSADIRFFAELLGDTGPSAYPPDLAISSMAPIGDLDDDGFDEILMGAPDTDGLGGQDSGKAYLVWGSDSTGTGYDLSTGSGDLDLAIAPHAYHGATADDRLGSSVAGAGDVNNDGFDDFLIGADRASNNDGAAYLFLGDGSQSPVNDYAAAEADYIFTGGQAFTTPSPDSSNISGHYAGRAVEGAGDIDGDGWDDVLISETHGSDRGMVWVFYGDSLYSMGPGTYAMSTSTADHLLLGEDAYESAGTSLTRVGDVDNDGNDDVLLGAPGWGDSINGDEGVTYLVTSGTLATLRITQPSNTNPFSPNLYLQNADYRFEGFSHSQAAGGDVAGVGDVDADGFADFLIGAGSLPNSWVMDGAYLFLGQNLGGPGTYLISDADYQFQGPQHSAYGSATGRGVAGPGDINGDGLDDLLVTNSSHAQTLSRAYVLLAP